MVDLRLHEKMKIALQRQGLTQRALAFQMGVSETAMSLFFKWGHGDNGFKKRIGEYLGFDTAEITEARS